MDLKQIDTFVHVADLGSFTRAASVLRVAQPALSRQVRALEVELRQSLFERNGRGVTLTPAGRLLLAHGRGILQQVERARLELEDARGAAAGLISIGLPPSLSTPFHKYAHMKSRLSGHGVVANPRDTTRYRCGCAPGPGPKRIDFIACAYL